MNRLEHPDDAAWIDRASGGDSSELDEHLDACADCQQRLTQFEEVIAVLRESRPESAPLHVLTAILRRQAAARKQAHRRPIASQLVRLAAAATIAALVFAGGYARGRHTVVIDGASTASRATLARAPLPAPPQLMLEPATAGVGDVAFAPWVRDSSRAGGEDPPAWRDSL